MRKVNRGFVGAALVLGALCVGAAPSHAGGHGDGWHGGGWHGGGWGGPRVAVNIGVGPAFWGAPRAAWWGWGRPAFYRPYAYGYYGGYYGAYYGGYYPAPPPVVYAPPPVVIQSAPVYIERQPAEDATAEAAPNSEPAYWYYCASARQYYPKVSSCREQWVKVLAQNP